jgi:hypothetical protein
MMRDAIRKAGEQAEIHYHPEEFRLTAEGEGSHIFNLENAYREYCAADEGARRVIVRNFVRGWFTPQKGIPEQFDEVHPDLLPMVRARTYYEVTQLRLRVEDLDDPGCPYQVLGEHLAIGLGYDLPESIVQIRQAMLAGWGVSFEQALEAARANLLGITQDPLQAVARGVWRSPWRDNHDASRLVLADYIRSHELRGDPVAVVPNRDSLLVTGVEDVAGLERLAEMAHEAADHPRFISTIPLRLQGDTWVPFLPAPEHPLHHTFRTLWLRSFASDYADQKEALDTLNEKRGEDLFVASCTVVQKRDSGEMRSYCVWTEGITSWLPRTDDVALFHVPEGAEEGEIVGLFPWERVQQVAGHLMERLEVYPERYRVSDFPSQEQIRLLQS